MNKTCTKCRTEKPLNSFSKDKRQKFGRRPECKVCEHQRPSYLLKAIRFRLKNCPRWYAGIENKLTLEDIESMSPYCYFCGKNIVDGASLHRLSHLGNYTVENVVKVHKVCHSLHGEHNKKPRKRIESFVE